MKRLNNSWYCQLASEVSSGMAFDYIATELRLKKDISTVFSVRVLALTTGFVGYRRSAQVFHNNDALSELGFCIVRDLLGP